MPDKFLGCMHKLMAHVLKEGKQYPAKHILTTCYKLRFIYILCILTELNGPESNAEVQKSVSF